MPEDCTHDCSTCGESCGERTEPFDFRAKANPNSRVKKVIAVMSGKGGVGKSLVTASLAAACRRLGHETAILDADVTGPSIPKAFGVHVRAMGDDGGILPVHTPSGLKLMSLNLLVENETDPVVWRGALIAGTVKQFWTDVQWGDVDYMFVDMPPGTGDVPLTVFQSLPVDGIVVVTSPQELVGMIVEKAVKMAEMMHLPVLGLVENYSYFQCPDCGKKHEIFGHSHIEEIAAAHSLPVLARVPIDPALAAACDAGEIETVVPNYLEDVAKRLCP